MSPTQLLNIDTLDFCNTADVAGYGVVLISYTNSHGIIQRKGQAFTMRTQIRSLAAQWTARIKSSINEMAPTEALDLLGTYDPVQRLILHREPEADFIFKYVNRAFEALIHGDVTINIYRLHNRISAGLRNKGKAYCGRPLDWNMMMLSDWHQDFTPSLTPLPAS